MRDDLSWCAKYLVVPYLIRGRDWDGCDCWGLNRLAFSTEKQIDLISYEDSYLGSSFLEESTRKEVEAVFMEERGSGPWVSVGKTNPQPWDMALYWISGVLAHVGLYVGGGRVLVTMESWVKPRLDLSDRPFWKSKLEGYYRHVDLA